MKSFVVFKVLGQLYGVDIDCVKRILPSQLLTTMPDEGAHIAGMFQYEDEIIKVLSFRKVIGQDSYEEQLKKKVFPELEAETAAWLDALKTCVQSGSEFSKSTNSHTSHLGKWVDSFHSDDKEVIDAVSSLGNNYQALHSRAVNVLETMAADPVKAKELMDEEVQEAYEATLTSLKTLTALSDKIAANLQRCLLLTGKEGNVFGVNIDDIDDIIHVDEDRLHISKETQHMGEFMSASAILEHDKRLITIITDVSIDKRSV